MVNRLAAHRLAACRHRRGDERRGEEAARAHASRAATRVDFGELACAAVAAWLAIAGRRKRQAASRKFTKVDVSVLLHMHSFGGGDAASGRGPSSPPPPAAAAPPKEWEEKYV